MTTLDEARMVADRFGGRVGAVIRDLIAMVEAAQLAEKALAITKPELDDGWTMACRASAERMRERAAQVIRQVKQSERSGGTRNALDRAEASIRALPVE